jgi:hypothetical protein
MTAPLATAGPLLLASYPQAVHMVDSFLWKAPPKHPKSVEKRLETPQRGQ